MKDDKEGAGIVLLLQGRESQVVLIDKNDRRRDQPARASDRFLGE